MTPSSFSFPVVYLLPSLELFFSLTEPGISFEGGRGRREFFSLVLFVSISDDP